jgi:4-alpha-glucanotransferase
MLVPLFSCHSTRSWGVGEFADLVPLAAWMKEAGLRTLLLLPLNEMAPGQTSPYSALSAMALDPLFIHVPDVPDLAALGGEDALDAAQRGVLYHVRARPGVDYRAVRALKNRVLRQAFATFLETHWVKETARAAELQGFIRAQAWWLDDYAVFRALAHVSDGQDWRTWPDAERAHSPRAVEQARREHPREVLYRQYLQWIAHGQWRAARRAAASVAVYGDFPFMVAADSADAWANQELFSFDATAGAPPDAFSRDGQNWKLPVYRWDVLRERRYDWFLDRARRAADLFDGFRVDHVVGLFRTWVFPLDGTAPHFTPDDEPTQITQGRAVLETIQRAGADVLAEDLGTIPDFVREAIAELGIPGYRVMRWERHWQAPGRPLVDPVGYPARSLATSGTHDTDTLAEWWDALSEEERDDVLAVVASRGVPLGVTLGAGTPFEPVVRDLILEALYASGSDLLVLPVQDIFGWRDRINVPAIVDEKNWTWKLPWPVDRLEAEPAARERQSTLARWAAVYGRAKP